VVRTEPTPTPTPTRTPTPPPARTVSILPAAAILGLAIVTLVVFGLMNMIGSQSTTPTTTPTILGGWPRGHTTAFVPWLRSGAMPSDVASALLVPRGTRLLGTVETGGGQFDREDRFVAAVPRARVLGFYRSHLTALLWSVISTSASAGGSAQLLFQKAGTDGFYWEAGITATTTTSGSTAYTFRVFQVSDFS
jgi:hypothetical protein